MKGTLFCMAPEVILKKGHDASADFWSFGVLIYESHRRATILLPRQAGAQAQILGMDPRRFNPSFPPDMPTACRMLLSACVRAACASVHKQDVAITGPSLFRRLDWERLPGASYLAVKQSVEAAVQSRQGRPEDTRSARLTENLRRLSRVRALRSCTIRLRGSRPWTTGSLRLSARMQRAHPMQE